jgi:hypothetical protein
MATGPKAMEDGYTFGVALVQYIAASRKSTDYGAVIRHIETLSNDELKSEARGMLRKKIDDKAPDAPAATDIERLVDLHFPELPKVER